MKTILVIVAAVFMLSTSVQAQTISCTVSTIKDPVITLDCQGKDLTLKARQKVTVKELKKKKNVIEGC